MSEATVTSSETSVRRLPLHEAHALAGASFTEQDGWLVPATYGDTRAEYDAVRREAPDAHEVGVMDLSMRGRIKVSGAEAVMFLNGLVTNDVKTLERGAWMPAAFPTAQGRLVASARILHTEDFFLIDTEAATTAPVLKILERFTLAGDFKVTNMSDELALISLQGAQASRAVSALFGESVAQVARRRIAHAFWRNAPATIIRATHTSEDGFDIFVPSLDASSLWQALRAEGNNRAVGFDAFDLLRVEAGVPRYGVDMSEANVVTEAPLDEAVSYSKGCYIGQEIIARIHWRGHVAKKLTGLVLDEKPTAKPSATPSSVAKVKSTDGKEIGRITSLVFSPRLQRHIALAYIRYDYLAPDTPAQVYFDEARFCAARVASLPLVRGSWYVSNADESAEVVNT